MLDTGFYIAMGAMPSGRQRQANLRALVDKARAFRKNQGSSLYGFIRYINAVKERKVASGQVKLVGEKEDLVRIMTIHKSKGLEFPMVILAGYCKNLNYTSMGENIMIHKDFGLGFPLVDYKNHWFKTTMMQNIIKEKFRREEVEEEKRVLYVAFTRAMDRLALLGICNDVQKELDKVGSEPPKDTSYFSMTGNRICTTLKQYEIIDDVQLAGLAKGRKRNIVPALKALEPEPEGEETRQRAINPQIVKQMEFKYPYEEDMYMKAKYSVSELNHMATETKEAKIPKLAEPASFKPKVSFTPAQRGTIYHCCLEHLDFAKAYDEGIDAISQTIDMLVDKEFLTADEAAIIDVENIQKLVQSPLGQRLAKSPQVWREQPFSLLDIVNGREVIIQGVIDCYFREGEDLVLIDYKTGKVNRSLPLEQEKARIAVQYATQMEIYRKALKLTTGRNIKEAYIYLTNCGELVPV